MISSRNPKCIVSLHSLIANQNILQCIVQRMSHMQLSCNIRRRHHRCERFSASVHLRMKILVLTPSFIQFFLDRFWIIGLCQFFTHNFLLKMSLFCSFPLVILSITKKHPLHQKCKGRMFRGTTFIICVRIYLLESCNVNNSEIPYFLFRYPVQKLPSTALS